MKPSFFLWLCVVSVLVLVSWAMTLTVWVLFMLPTPALVILGACLFLVAFVVAFDAYEVRRASKRAADASRIVGGGK